MKLPQFSDVETPPPRLDQQLVLLVLCVYLLCSDALLLPAQSSVLLLKFLVVELQCISPLENVDQ